MRGFIAKFLKSSIRARSANVPNASTRSCRKIASWALIGLGITGAGTGSGCSREYYRKDADEEAASLIQEKENDPRWCLPERSVYVDSRSRYYDPYDPDREPLPPDDPKSHEFMHCVYGMKGYKRWHENGETTQLANPAWREYLDDFMTATPNGEYDMDLQDALQLALLNSPRYQTNVETLYLSALDVAFERFRFDVQFFAGNRTTWLHRGSEPSGDSSTTLSTVNSARAAKLFPAGGQFLADFANTFVWQFAGPNENTRAESLLSFTFLQPLLRQGGRQVAMEQLTLAERGLLANVRQMERYRQGFLIDVAMGTGPVQGPSRQGGFLGGAGLSGFTGTGTGGFAGVGEASNFGRIGGAGGGGGTAGGGAGQGFAAGVAGNVGGFVGLAQQRQQVRNREANLALQLENLARMEDLFRAGRIENTAVIQFRQNVQTTRSQYLAAVNSYQQQLETFLIGTLGLPPDLPVYIDEKIIEPFQFTDPKLSQLRTQVNSLTERIRTAEDPTVETIRRALDEIQGLFEPVSERFGSVRANFQQLNMMEGERLRALSAEKDRKEFLEQLSLLRDQFKSLEMRFDGIRESSKKVRDQLAPDELGAAHRLLVSQYEELSEILLELGFNQAGVRLEAIVLAPVKIDSELAFRIAQTNRLDIMNQRAEVVDQWRFIAFNANRLEADLNIELNGSIGTLDRNIVKFRDQTGSFSASVRFDAPITRLAERNIYRQALIDYQRVRRNYIQFEDTVNATLRSILRSVALFEQEIELRRQAMRIAIRQMDLNQLRLKEPPRVGVGGGAQGDPVRDLLGAFSDFLETQNGVMNTYLSYQALRMQLYRDLGIVRFDENGMWVDEPLETALQRLTEEGDPFIPPACPPMTLDLVSPAVAETTGNQDEAVQPAAVSTAMGSEGAKNPERKTLRAIFLRPRRLLGDSMLPSVSSTDVTRPAAIDQLAPERDDRLSLDLDP